MMCEWHFNCEHPVTHRIKKPDGEYLFACQEGASEFKRFYPIKDAATLIKRVPGVKRVPGTKPTPIPVKSVISEDDIKALKLTKKERKELDSMPEDERDAVLRFLIKANSSKSRSAS